ncbi:hypothetical protein ACQP2U_43000 (plasmid) [Nocardia sp. CA-084685]|uniref:hypothetical protein n=1 Tax=Nocardia sp. CA-084685 TaxID=3239970 RepID=UPI003D96B80E
MSRPTQARKRHTAAAIGFWKLLPPYSIRRCTAQLDRMEQAVSAIRSPLALTQATTPTCRRPTAAGPYYHRGSGDRKEIHQMIRKATFAVAITLSALAGAGSGVALADADNPCHDGCSFPEGTFPHADPWPAGPVDPFGQLPPDWGPDAQQANQN